VRVCVYACMNAGACMHVTLQIKRFTLAESELCVRMFSRARMGIYMQFFFVRMCSAVRALLDDATALHQNTPAA
jgi:hypothetical protein